MRHNRQPLAGQGNPTPAGGRETTPQQKTPRPPEAHAESRGNGSLWRGLGQSPSGSGQSPAGPGRARRVRAEPGALARALNLALALTLLVLLTGCGAMTPFEEMLSPPKLTGEQSEIYQALINGKSSAGFNLKYPRSGDYRSAFVVQDLDDEETLEAIVFYESTGVTSERSLWMSFLDQSDGEWEAVYDLSFKGTDIDRVIFAPLGLSAGTSIIVCYSISQTEKAFQILRYQDRTITKLYSDTYTYLQIGDYFHTGEELFYIKNDRTLETCTATFFAWQDDLFTRTGTVDMDGSARDYTTITTGDIANGVYAMIIDHNKYADSTEYGTDILVRMGSSMVNLVFLEGTNAERLVRRTSSVSELVAHTDIDGDGLIELSSTVDFPGYGAASVDTLYATVWRAFEEGSFNIKYYSYYSAKNDYIFVLPSRWRNLTTVTVTADGGQADFWIAPTSEGGAGGVSEVEVQLLSIRAIHPDTEEAPPHGDGWGFYTQNATTGITYYIKRYYPATDLVLTDAELADAFRFAPQGEAN